MKFIEKYLFGQTCSIYKQIASIITVSVTEEIPDHVGSSEESLEELLEKSQGAPVEDILLLISGEGPGEIFGEILIRIRQKNPGEKSCKFSQR